MSSTEPLSPEKVAGLREVAVRAGSSRWHIVPYGDGDSLVIHEGEDWRVCFMATPGASPGALDRIEAKAEHIATFSPAQAIAHATGGGE